MKKTRRLLAETDLRRYDWSRASRGRLASRPARSLRLALIDQELWAHFGSSEAVNHALRAVVEAAKSVRAPAKARRRTKPAA